MLYEYRENNINFLTRIRTIYAVFVKEITLLMRYPTWILELLIWPILFPLMYILSALGMAGPDQSGLSAFKSATGTTSYMGYIMIGTMVWNWVNITMWTFGSFLRDEQMRGTLESNWLCPINRFDLLLGGGLSTLFQSFIMTLVSVIEYKIIFRVNFTGNIFCWLLIFLILTPAVYGLGLLFASVILWLKDANAAVNLVRGIIMIICGITFPVSVMPGVLQTIAKFVPFTYGIEASRQIMVNGKGFTEAGFNIIMCIFEGAVLLLLGRLFFRAIENKVRVSGSLERF